MQDREYQAFPYDEIERSVDGLCPEDDRLPRTYSEADLTRYARGYLAWVLIGSPYSTARGELRPCTGMNRTIARTLQAEVIAKRLIASAWVIDAGLLEGMSLAAIGRLPGVNSSRRALAMHAVDFEKMFGVRCRGMRTKTNRVQLSDSAKKRRQRALQAACPVPADVGAN